MFGCVIPLASPKLYDLEVPEPVGMPSSLHEDLPFMPDASAPPTDRRTLIHHLTIHVLDVVDRMVPFMELHPDFDPENDEDLSCYHG
ncbi:hypothetical protein D1007_51505 [Hordeum vulgare]|nr:hypothetical protein D1007_51505 [Hordeum vulgare]